VVVRDLITLLGFKLEDGPQKQYDRQIDQTKEKSVSLAKAARGIGTAYKVAAGLAAVAVGWISKNVIEATVEMEAYRTQMEAFAGSAEAAADALANLRDKKADALFGTGTLVSTYKQLRTVGMGAEDTSRMIDVLGDVANGSAENFSALGNILTRVSTTGKVNEATLRQLANAGFGVQDMAQGLGMTAEQLTAKIAAGKIGFNELTKAMQGATAEGGRFFGNAEKQANTLGGALKILKSTIDNLRDAIGTGVIPKLVGLIRYITDLVKLGQSGLANFGQNAFEFLIHVIYQVIIFFEVLQMRMKKFGSAFAPIKAIAKDVFDFFKSVVQSAAPYWMNLAQLILVAFKPIQAFVKPVLESLKPIIKSVFGFMAKTVEKLIPIVNGLAPVFSGLGKFIGVILGPILGIAVAVKGVNTAIAIGKGAIAGFNAVMNIGSGISALFSGNMLQMAMSFRAAGVGQKAINALAGTFNLLTGKVDLATAAANKNRLAQVLLALQTAKTKVAELAHAAALKIKAAATLIAAKVQAAFNAVMSANPIAIIIIAIIALIAVIVLLVKNWDKVGPAIKKAFSAVGDFFKGIWNGIKSFFSKAVEFVKSNLLNIVNIVLTVLFPIAGIVMAIVRLAIKHWDKIKDAVFAVANKIKEKWNEFKNFFMGLWEGIKNFFAAVGNFFRSVFSNAIEGTKADWEEFVGFISAIWEGIKNIASAIWNGIKDIFFGAVESVKNAWKGIIGFFAGLWEALKQGPSEALEYIKDAFFGLFDKIREKFFGFIGAIRDGFEKVKTFFGGIGKGVVNFFAGGDGTGRESPGNKSGAAAPMGGLAMAAATSAASSYHTYNTGGSTNSVNANSQITVNVPAGTSSEQAQAISRQVDQAVQSSWASAIGGARSTIPSPEARRR